MGRNPHNHRVPLGGTRTTEVDTLRGAALLGICIVNVPFLAGLDYLAAPSEAVPRLTNFLIALLFQGKFFVLFSFLFGWGFAIQLASAQRSSRNFRSMYLRRLSGLLFIGIAHALLVFIGDILVLYAILGVVLLPLRNLTPARLLRIATALIAAAFVSLALLGLILSGPIEPPDAWTGYLGTFGDAITQRWYDWPYGLGFVMLFNGPVALAAFCAGLAAAKVGFFSAASPVYEKVANHWPGLLVFGLVLNIAYALAAGGFLGDGLLALFAFAGLAIGGPCLASVYLLGIVKLSRRGILVGSRAAGRMSLTAYVAEGVLAGLLFNGYGLGYYGQISEFGCVGVAVAIFAVVHMFCIAWLKWQRRGPLETLLRWITSGFTTVPQSR